MTWAALFSIVCAVLAWIAVVVNATRVRKIRRERAELHQEKEQLEGLRLELLAHRAWLEENEVRYILRQALPTCGKCGLAFRQTGPKDFSHTFCPAET